METKKTCCEDELYGGDPCAVEEAEKEIENKRLFVKKAMKPAEDDVKDLVKATATTEVRLQGTKETKAPELKPYTETFAKDRTELTKLIGEARKSNKAWRIERSMKEGYRYVFITKNEILTEDKKEDKDEENGIEFDTIPEEDAMKYSKEFMDSEGKEEPKGEEGEVTPEEPTEEPKEEKSEEELDACVILANHLDMHGEEDHSVTLSLKGELDDEKAPHLVIKDLSDEEYEVLKGTFHEEEAEEKPSEETSEIDFEEVDFGDEEEVEESCKIEEGYFNDVFHKVLGEKGQAIPTKVALDEARRLLNSMSYDKLDATTLDNLSDCIKFLRGSVEESLSEASSAEKKAYKNGGQDYDDLVTGRAIARIKDPKAREAAIASIRAKRPEVAKQFIGQRKDDQAQISLQKKMQKIDTAVNEELNEDTTVNDNLEISLDDLQYFKPCAGARDTWKAILDNDKLDDLAKSLGDFAKDGKMTTTDLNDLLWFEKDWVYDTLGINPSIKSGDDVIDVDIEEPEDEDKEDL